MRFAKIGEREITEIVRYFVQVDSCYMLCVQNDFKDLSWWLLLIQFGNQEQEALAAVGSLMKTNFILYSGCRRVTQPGMHCACGLKFIVASLLHAKVTKCKDPVSQIPCEMPVQLKKN